MGKRKIDKLEKMYQLIDSEYQNASEDEIRAGLSNGDGVLERNNEEIEKFNEEIERLKGIITTKKQLVAALQGKDGAEKSHRIQNAIAEAEAEIQEAEDKIKKAEDKIKEKESESSTIKSGKANLRAYSKNKDQIRQIRAFKESIAKKLPAEIQKRDDSKAKMEAAEASLKDANKKLADEKLTMEMDQYEYNALLEQKATAEKDIKEQTEIYKKAKDRILELQTKMGKCDLAWKTLFTGKSWDDIQRRALDPNTKFIRHVKEDEKLKPDDAKKLTPEEQMKQDIARTVDEVRGEQGKNEGEGKNDLPAPTPKHPTWEKIKGFFKKAGNKLKEIFVGDEEPQKSDYSKMDDIPADKRDQFLEELRRHVDKEYGKEVKEQKEAQYREQHQNKPKANESQGKDER